MKIKRIALNILLLTIFSFIGTKQEVLAATIPQAIPSSISIGITPYAEEKIWRYRTTETGKRQKRLWSITYKKWLTDWIDIP